MRDSIDVLPNNYYVNTLTHKSTEGKVWFEPSVITLLGPEGVTNNTKIHIAAMQYLYLVEFWEIHTIFINHLLGRIIQNEFCAMGYAIELYLEKIP